MTDDDLLQRFETGSLARSDWTHAAHVRVAWIYLNRRAFDEAAACMSEGVKRLNESIGVVNGPDGGYHETITQAWLRVIGGRIRSDGADGAAATSEAFLARHGDLLDKRLLLRHYTRDLINSSRARFEFVAPDAQPLPEPTPSQ